MKTKNIKSIYIFTFLVLMLTGISNLYSQNNWPEVGTEWYYSFRPCIISNCPDILEFINLKVTKDTTLNDTLCKKIDVFYHKENMEVQLLGNEFIYSTNDCVFNYHHGAFRLLYDYNVEIDDTIELSLGSNTDIYSLNNNNAEYIKTNHIVKDIDSIAINSIYFKTVTFNYAEDFNTKPVFEEKIIKGIGSLDYFTGKLVSPIEVNYYGPLRCYKTKEFTYHFSDENISCDTLITSNIHFISNENIEINIFPNPSNGEIYIKVLNDFIRSIYIYNDLGRISYADENANSQIYCLNNESLIKGLYILKIITKSDKTLTKKIIIK